MNCITKGHLVYQNPLETQARNVEARPGDVHLLHMGGLQWIVGRSSGYPLDLSLWALAFTLLPWPERQKAELWFALQAGQQPLLEGAGHEDILALEKDLPRLREEAVQRGARLCLPGEEGVDRLMGELPYPVALWVKGSLPPEGLSIAVVGARQASDLGRKRTRRWARELTEAGVHVLSGLARGIDGAAHEGALEAGPTWAVLGSGLDHLYPREHTALADRIVAAGGGLITPFPPQAKPLAWHFPRRNWLLAAWTQGVLVMEAKLRSGSLVTAKLALDLGKELWVCPGAPEHLLSEGTNFLLREGAARLCRSSADLLEDIRGLTRVPMRSASSGPIDSLFRSVP
jgi:DNA processing protein